MDVCPLHFWSSRRLQVPYLATLAVHVLGMPATTAALERLFSGAGRAICRRKPRLTSKRASAMILAMLT